MQEINAPAVEMTSNDAPVTDHSDAQASVPTEGGQPEAKPENPFKGTKHKYKAKGKEIEVDYETLLAKASLADGADLTFQEAKAFRREIEERLKGLSDPERENFDEIVEVLGFEKALKFADTISQKKLEWQNLSEEERERLLERHEYEATKRQLDELKGKEAQQAKAQASQKAYEAINQEIGDALSEARANGIPLADLPDIAVAIVDEMLSVLEAIDAEERAGKKWSGKAPSAKDVVQKLQKQYEERSASYIKKLNAKSLRSMLTPEQLAELRQEEIETLYSGSTPQRMTKPVEGNPSQAQLNQNQQSPRAKTSNDWFKLQDERFGVRR